MQDVAQQDRLLFIFIGDFPKPLLCRVAFCLCDRNKHSRFFQFAKACIHVHQDSCLCIMQLCLCLCLGDLLLIDNVFPAAPVPGFPFQLESDARHVPGKDVDVEIGDVVEGNTDIGNVIGLSHAAVVLSLSHAEFRLFDLRALCQCPYLCQLQIDLFERCDRNFLCLEFGADVATEKVIEIFLARVEGIAQLSQLVLFVRELRLHVHAVGLERCLL